MANIRRKFEMNDDIGDREFHIPQDTPLPPKDKSEGISNRSESTLEDFGIDDSPYVCPLEERSENENEVSEREELCDTPTDVTYEIDDITPIHPKEDPNLDVVLLEGHDKIYIEDEEKCTLISLPKPPK